MVSDFICKFVLVKISINNMKYLGITYGKIIEGFSIIPNVNLLWITLKEGRYYDVQFSWLRWYFTIGQVNKKLKQNGY